LSFLFFFILNICLIGLWQIEDYEVVIDKESVKSIMKFATQSGRGGKAVMDRCFPKIFALALTKGDIEIFWQNSVKREAKQGEKVELTDLQRQELDIKMGLCDRPPRLMPSPSPRSSSSSSSHYYISSVPRSFRTPNFLSEEKLQLLRKRVKQLQECQDIDGAKIWLMDLDNEDNFLKEDFEQLAKTQNIAKNSGVTDLAALDSNAKQVRFFDIFFSPSLSLINKITGCSFRQPSSWCLDQPVVYRGFISVFPFSFWFLSHLFPGLHAL